MRLTDRQLADYERDGYIFLPELFSAAEVAAMKRAASRIYGLDRPEIQREKDGSTPRTAFAAHTYDDTMGKVARHPKLVDPAMQMLGGEVYIHHPVHLRRPVCHSYFLQGTVSSGPH